MRPSFISLFCLLSSLGCSSQTSAVLPAEASTASTVPTAPPSEASEAARIHKPFLGRWTGTLEYRDYTSEARVRLPTQLEVTPSGDGTSLRFSYLYDDGPTKKVREVSTVIIDAVARTMTVVSGEGGSRTVYAFADDADLTGLREKGEGSFSLSGKGVENDREVVVRLTLTLRRNHYQLLRETQVTGEPFLFRHEYSFTRAG